MAWGIFRGIIAVYSCVGLAIFSAYSVISEVQLYASSDIAFALQETILPYSLAYAEDGLVVNIVNIYQTYSLKVDFMLASRSPRTLVTHSPRISVSLRHQAWSVVASRNHTFAPLIVV